MWNYQLRWWCRGTSVPWLCSRLKALQPKPLLGKILPVLSALLAPNNQRHEIRDTPKSWIGSGWTGVEEKNWGAIYIHTHCPNNDLGEEINGPFCLAATNSMSLCSVLGNQEEDTLSSLLPIPSISRKHGSNSFLSLKGDEPKCLHISNQCLKCKVTMLMAEGGFYIFQESAWDFEAQISRSEPSCSHPPMLKFGVRKGPWAQFCRLYFLWDHSGSSLVYRQGAWMSWGVFWIPF